MLVSEHYYHVKSNIYVSCLLYYFYLSPPCLSLSLSLFISSFLPSYNDADDIVYKFSILVRFREQKKHVGNFLCRITSPLLTGLSFAVVSLNFRELCTTLVTIKYNISKSKVILLWLCNPITISNFLKKTIGMFYYSVMMHIRQLYSLIQEVLTFF